MMENNRPSPAVIAITLLIVLFSLVPKFLMFSNYVVEPFTNSVVALTMETQASGHVPLSPYDLQGYWQTHADFISFRAGIVSFFTILSSVTGLSAYTVGSIPLIGILMVFFGYLLGMAFGSRFTAVALAVVFGFSWHPTLTGTNIGYQSYGALLELIMFWVVTMCVLKWKKWSRSHVLIFCLLFLATYKVYYSAEFAMLAFLVVVTLLFALHRIFNFNSRTIRRVSFLALLCSIIFLAFDTVEYSYLSSSSLKLFETSLLDYLSYVRSIIFRESVSIQEYRPYTSPVSKYVDLSSNMIIWAIIGLSVLLYLNELRKRNRSTLSDEKVEIHVIVLSFIFVFFSRLMIYGMLGKIAIGWIYLGVIPIILSLIWLYPKSKPNLKYFLPLLLIGLTVFRFSIIWTDQTMVFVGANYPPMVNASAQWIAQNLKNGSIVSSNQVSAQIFSTVASSGKANSISVNQFGADSENLTESLPSLHNLLASRGYNYVMLLRVFRDQPVFGGFWGPYVSPLGDRVEEFGNSSLFTKIYDDGMSTIYGT